MPFRGEYSGPLRIRGDVSDLAVTGDLVGDAGRIQLTGQFGAVASRYRAVAHGSVSGLDMRRALERTGVPESGINGRFAVDLAGDSLADVSGSAHLFVDRSTVDGVRVYGGQAALRFDDGLARVDSLRIESGAGLLHREWRAGVDRVSERFACIPRGGGFARRLAPIPGAGSASG